MRYGLVFIVISVLAGCRSAQVAFHEQACQTNSCNISDYTTANAPFVETYPSSIRELIQLGVAENPRLRQSRHEIAILKHRIPQALSLPDPIVNTTTHLSPVETAAGRQAFALGLNQKYVNADRRATKAAMVHDELRTAQAELIRLEQELSEKIRITAYQLLAIQETIRITVEDVNSLAQLEESVLRQYEVKTSTSQQDVLNIQIEQSQLENQLTNLRQKEKSYSARLARLANLDPTSTFEISDTLQHAAFESDVDAMILQAKNARPELAAQLAQIQKNRRAIHLAHLQNRPDFNLGLNWIATSSAGISPVANGDDAVLLGIGFNLPVRKGRIRAAACEARESVLASKARFESIQDEIAEEVFDTVAKLDSTSSTLQLLADDIIPKSERALDLSIEEFANAKTGYEQLISNWRSLLKYKVALVNLQSQRLQLLASLGRQVGQNDPITVYSSNSVEE